MVAIKRLVQQTEPELLQLSERLVSGSLASSSAPSAAAITAVLRTDPALQRLAPRLHSTLAGAARSGGLRHGRQAAGRLFQQHDAAQQVGLPAQVRGEASRRGIGAMLQCSGRIAPLCVAYVSLVPPLACAGAGCRPVAALVQQRATSPGLGQVLSKGQGAASGCGGQGSQG